MFFEKGGKPRMVVTSTFLCLLFFFILSFLHHSSHTVRFSILNSLEISTVLGFVHLGHGYPENTRPILYQNSYLGYCGQQINLQCRFLFYISLLSLLGNSNYNENKR